MIHDVIARAADSIWPQISLLVFVLCFLGVIVWTYRGRKDRFREQAALPLEDQPEAKIANGADHGE